MRGVISQKHSGHVVIKSDELGDKIALLADDIKPPTMINNLSVGDEVEFSLDLWRVLGMID
jgi:hypothetical protein